MKITICGSARFEQQFKYWNERLTLAGHVVYSLSVYPSDKGNKDWYTAEEKEILDRAHLSKIFESDAILVLNINEYVGDSTRREIDFAKSQAKRIFRLNTTTYEKSADYLLQESAELYRLPSLPYEIA